MVLETGFAMKVTLRAVRGRPVLWRRRGVRSVFELCESPDVLVDDSIATKTNGERFVQKFRIYQADRLADGHTALCSNNVLRYVQLRLCCHAGKNSVIAEKALDYNEDVESQVKPARRIFGQW